MNDKKTSIRVSIDKLDKWLELNEWKAYDPFDGLNAKYLNRLTFDNHYLRIVLQQSVRRFPLNLRPILGIKKETSSKGMGFCAWGYLKMFQYTKDEYYLKKLKMCLEWLKKNYSDGYSGYAWGNHFSYEARGGKIPKGVPSIVWTSLITNVFFEAYEVLKYEEYINIAQSACKFIFKNIPKFVESNDSICLEYTPTRLGGNSRLADCIHNSNVLGAWMLARLYKYNKDKEILDIAKKAINFTVKYQLDSGGWYYGVGKKYWWIDNFHTGYVLDSLIGYLKSTGDDTFEDPMFKGFKYFKSNFFLKDGTPKYYNYKIYPLDIQCPSQAIQTLINFREYDTSSIDLAVKVAIWTISHMQDSKGYFYYRKYPFLINKTPMFHWGQSTMFSALANLYSAF